MKYVNVILGFLLLVFFSWLVYLVVNVDYTQPNSTQIFRKRGANTRVTDLLQLTNDTLSESNNFQYDKYLISKDFSNFRELQINIDECDSIYNDIDKTQGVFYTVLTEKLSEKININSYNADTLIGILYWADNFELLAQIDTTNSILFDAVHSYWYQFVSDKMDSAHFINSNLKYDFSYRLIKSKLANASFLHDDGNTKMEKLVFQLVDRNYSYVLNRFWNGTSSTYKVVLFGSIFVLTMLSSLGLYTLINFLWKKRT